MFISICISIFIHIFMSIFIRINIYISMFIIISSLFISLERLKQEKVTIAGEARGFDKS